MAKLLKLRRGTTTQHGSFTGAEGEVTVDTNKDTLVVHDGSTQGGHPVAAEDMANVSSSSILSRIGNGDIVGTKLENSGVSAGQYGSSSAIPIVTVDAQGLVTAASTTAIDSTTIANGTSNVAVASNGNITTTRSGTARLVVDDGGIDVTGSYTGTGQLSLSFNSSSKIQLNGNDDSRIYFQENGTDRGYLGWDSGEDGYWLWNNQQGKGFLLNATPKWYDGSGYGTLWHSRNDGSGSGLDADTVDGLQAGSFLRSDTADSTNALITASAGLRPGNLSVGETAHSNTIQQVSGGTLHLQYNVSGDLHVNEGGGYMQAREIRPEANNSYDLGTTSKRWRNIYTNDLHLSNEGSSNDIDSTWGDWTIQEGESDLFLKNNRSGKKYKFNLTEVS